MTRLLLSMALGAICLATLQAAGPPNIIVLLADDLRHDTLGFAGHSSVQTPHLDALAKRSTRFPNAFVTTAICAVSRASIFSGQYARRHGIHDFATPFTAEQWAQSYPELLKRAGYKVGFIGKFGVGNAAPTNTFDYWDGFNGQGRYLKSGETNHLTAQMGESAIRFLRDSPSGPFCLSISFKAPHAQDGATDREFPPDARDEDLYEQSKFPPGPSVNEEAFQKLPPFLKQSEARTRWQRRFASDEMRERTVRDYLRLVTGMDREIGRIRAALEELGLAQNTVILFTSDNGFYLGEHGLAGKWFMHEESIRVPLLIHDPRGPRPRAPKEMALNLDIAPTILDYAGVIAPSLMQGRSLRPFVQGKKPSNWREDFYYEHHFEYGGKIPSSEGVRSDRWKYVRYINQNPPLEQLFDLRRDPRELTELANNPRREEDLRRLRARWAQLRESVE